MLPLEQTVWVNLLVAFVLQIAIRQLLAKRPLATTISLSVTASLILVVNMALMIPRPVFVSLLAALFGMLVAEGFMRGWKKEGLSDLFCLAALVVLLVTSLAFIGVCSSALEEITHIMARNKAVAWQNFAAKGEAERFVFENYRQCLDGDPSGIRKSSCAASSALLASTLHGQEFATRVVLAIHAWEKFPKITSADKARVDRLLHNLGLDGNTKPEAASS